MKRYLVCLALPIALLAALPARAESVLSDIIARGTLRVGLTGDYRPFSIKEADGKFSGMDVDAAEALAKSMGVKLEIVPTAWPTLMADMLAHKYDVAMGGITITLDRAKTAYFSTPVMRSGKTPIARCADTARFETLADIDKPGTRVIVNPGGTNERFARAHVKSAQIEVYPDNVTIFDEIAKGHADLMMTDASETRYQQKLHPGVLCAVHPDKPFQFGEKAYMVPRGDVAFQQYVDQWLHLALSTGEYQAISDKWLK